MSIFTNEVVSDLVYPRKKQSRTSMHENFTDFIASLSSSPKFIGSAMAVLMAVLSALYDDKRFSFFRVCIECATLALMVFMAVDALYIFEVDPRWSGIIGGIFGAYGTKTVKSLGLLVLRSRIPEPKDRRDSDSK